MNQVCVCCCCVDWLMSRATVVGAAALLQIIRDYFTRQEHQAGLINQHNLQAMRTARRHTLNTAWAWTKHTVKESCAHKPTQPSSYENCAQTNIKHSHIFLKVYVKSIYRIIQSKYSFWNFLRLDRNTKKLQPKEVIALSITILISAADYNELFPQLRTLLEEVIKEQSRPQKHWQPILSVKSASQKTRDTRKLYQKVLSLCHQGW